MLPIYVLAVSKR